MRCSDVAAARELLDGVTRETPLLGSRALSDGRYQVFLKCENLQRTGSFKIRGAYVRIHRLSERDKQCGVVAASAGNHAQGVALAANLLGVRATVFMPQGASLPKIAATTSYGADVQLVGSTVDDALAEAESYAERRKSVLVHPFDHPDVIAGQGTVGLEILEQCRDVGTVLVGTGGGGLLAGIATAIKAIRPGTKVLGVQAAGAAAWPPALSAGGPVTLRTMNTIADGIAVGRAGQVTFEIVRNLVDDVVTVSEESLSQALLLCLERSKLVVEPAGAATVAALLEYPGRFDSPMVAVLSGGNIDPLLMLRVLRHGLAEASRFLRVTLRLPDVPGALARLLLELGLRGANVLDVEHVRTTATLNIRQADVELQLETRGPEHIDELLTIIQKAGYTVLG